MAVPSQEAKDAYLQSVVEGASREQLLLMLLDGAVKFMTKAEAAFDEEKWDELHNQLCRVQNIFTELALSLDFEAGDFAARLADIYGFINGLLIQANVDRDREAFDESKRIIIEIRDMWSETISIACKIDPNGGGPDSLSAKAEAVLKSINVTG